MAKLPKRSTMIATINRVDGYAHKLFKAGKISEKKWFATVKMLNDLITEIMKS